ncbi:uncharacterized protein si:ch73-109d9.2 [Brachionichthys hirsutus]|uniref:uncharacterized protein si:ch73-109d9.2 n=1 Tax=Brachionichthys hirsutus TaxID=412623 RepID=UPI0036049AD7
MAEAIVTFQTQLSGVMETVFKAAMYEITRLVEESFLEEITRCREQVETLKRRLKWSEGRRKGREGDRRGGCMDGEEQHMGTACTDGTSLPVCQSPGVQSEKLDRLLKEEALRITSESNESQERWGVNLEETEASNLPGPSKPYSEQKIPKSHVAWETGSAQRPQSGREEHSLYQVYGMKDFGGFNNNKVVYRDGNMVDMGDMEGFQGSPPHLGEDLSYMGHLEGEVESTEGAKHQAYQEGALRNRRGAESLNAGSPSRINSDVSGEFSCLLINEQGYLQDLSILHPEQVSSESGGRSGLRSQGTVDMCGPSAAYTNTLHLDERLQHHAGGTRRRHTCNQPAMSFSDTASIKAHKQPQKGVGQGPPYSCTQCGKSFTQACNLKVHQRIHSGQGLHLCSHCGKNFPSFSDLKTHKCDQTGEKPHCCTVCGNKFSRLWNLKLHQRIHTQEKPHSCTMCDKSFTRADILKVHQRTHTGERPYCCPVCGLSFKRLDHLKSHQRKHVADL